MKAHKTIMVAIVVVAIAIIIFAPSLNISRGFGFLLLICPLMMLAMMSVMGGHEK